MDYVYSLFAVICILFGTAESVNSQPKQTHPCQKHIEYVASWVNFTKARQDIGEMGNYFLWTINKGIFFDSDWVDVPATGSWNGTELSWLKYNAERDHMVAQLRKGNVITYLQCVNAGT